MRVLVCGGRDLDRTAAWNWLEQNAKDEIAYKLGVSSFTIEAIIHGNARGADQGAGDWGKSEGCKVLAYPANWRKFGSAAGPIRNREMLEKSRPDIVIALPGGAGTANMVMQAKAVGVPVVEVQDFANIDRPVRVLRGL